MYLKEIVVISLTTPAEHLQYPPPPFRQLSYGTKHNMTSKQYFYVQTATSYMYTQLSTILSPHFLLRNGHLMKLKYSRNVILWLLIKFLVT